MSLVKNNNIVEDAVDLLQQKDRDYLTNTNLVKCLVSEIQEVEDAMYEVYTQFGIYTAIGAQLDVVGLLVGESRVGRSDDAYRTAILARIQLNIGAGEPDTIINALKQWLNPTRIDFSEPYPAFFSIFIQSTIDIPNIATIVKEISPAGVGCEVTTLPSGLNPLIFGTSKGEAVDFVVQANPLPAALDDYLVDEVDTLQIEAIQTPAPSSVFGFGTAYLDGTISTFGGRFATIRV